MLEPLVIRYPANAKMKYRAIYVYENLADLLRETRRPEEASTMAQKALPLARELVRDWPGRPEYMRELAMTLKAAGDAAVRKAPADASRLLEEALTYSQAVSAASPNDIESAVLSCMLYGSLTVARLEMHDYVAAAAALDAVEPALHQAEDMYATACQYVRCLQLAEADGKLSSEKRNEVRELYAQRALNTLRRAIDSGYGNRVQFKTDSRLDPLRGRAEFKRLLAGLEANDHRAKTGSPADGR